MRQKRKRDSSFPSSSSSSTITATAAAPVPVPSLSTVVAPDDDIEDENCITVFSVVKVKKRKVNGEKKPLDFGIVISIHNKGEAYTIEFSSDDHVETHVPSRKVKLASFERKKRRQANKNAHSKRKERKKRRRLETLREVNEDEEEEMEEGGEEGGDNDGGGSSRRSKKRSKKNNGKKGLVGMETQKKRKNKKKNNGNGESNNKRSLSSKRSNADQPKDRQRPFYCSQLVTVLWRDKYYSGDIVTDHENGSYDILYTDFDTSNYEESVRRRRIKKRDLKPTKKDLAASLEGRRVRVLWANEAAYFSGVVQGRGTGKDEGKHVIEYDDGDVMVHDLSAETVQLEPYDPDAAEKSPASSEEMETSSGGGAGGKVEPKQAGGKSEKKATKIKIKIKSSKTSRRSSKSSSGAASTAEFDVGDIVQCKALNSRWYRAIINAVHEGAGTYTVLYERSNTVEDHVSSDRVQTYVKARDRLRNGTPRNAGAGLPGAKGKEKSGKPRPQKRRKRSGGESSIEQTSAEETGDSSEESESEESESESSESDSSEDEAAESSTAAAAADAAPVAAAGSKGKKKGKAAKKAPKTTKASKASVKSAKSGKKGAAAASTDEDKKKATSRSSRAARAAKIRVLSEAAQKVCWFVVSSGYSFSLLPFFLPSFL